MSNPAGLLLVGVGGLLIYMGAKSAGTTTTPPPKKKPKTGDITSGGGPGTPTEKALGAAATMGVQPAANAITSMLHHFLETGPVKVGQPAPHNPFATETIGGKKYHDVKNKKGQWVYAAGPAPPHKAPKKVVKTPPKMPKAHELPAKPHKALKAKTLPAPAHRSGTGLVAI